MGAGHTQRQPGVAETAPGHRLSQHRDGDSGYAHRSRPHGAVPLAVAVVLTLGFAVVELLGGLWTG